ncbi:uncharacterized protein CELE_R13A1.1 [Caenorhabditis elegans]|uniref:Uncharacterized protein n=1 Tax=Caenorhabditis elegans TaxID=6239 RepID=D0VWL9_CAEEL|nr:Uncharacterized protein CELE_R13A1.1 [Caenorhabditis elegans]CCD67158.1 Uncharacterized protein CELE_R13A1.1 [Caenorhabditis elegans]|eukprot:NP_501143.2 Uncharacterized protein CELE_R13A1.1 [Caenorhabditis elegans]
MFLLLLFLFLIFLIISFDTSLHAIPMPRGAKPKGFMMGLGVCF